MEGIWKGSRGSVGFASSILKLVLGLFLRVMSFRTIVRIRRVNGIRILHQRMQGEVMRSAVIKCETAVMFPSSTQGQIQIAMTLCPFLHAQNACKSLTFDFSR